MVRGQGGQTQYFFTSLFAKSLLCILNSVDQLGFSPVLFYTRRYTYIKCGHNP